jgi:hypothetical protein
MFIGVDVQKPAVSGARALDIYGEITMVELPMGVRILRKPSSPVCPFITYFKGFERVKIVGRIFGEEAEAMLCSLVVEFTEETCYMKVSDIDGRLLVNPTYLESGDTVDLYLDVIHELVHVRQFMNGRSLYKKNQSYVERETEIEAYQIAVIEARVLGLSDGEIRGYLESELLNNEELARLAKVLDVG